MRVSLFFLQMYQGLYSTADVVGFILTDNFTVCAPTSLRFGDNAIGIRVEFILQDFEGIKPVQTDGIKKEIPGTL